VDEGQKREVYRGLQQPNPHQKVKSRTGAFSCICKGRGHDCEQGGAMQAPCKAGNYMNKPVDELARAAAQTPSHRHVD